MDKCIGGRHKPLGDKHRRTQRTSSFEGAVGVSCISQRPLLSNLDLESTALDCLEQPLRAFLQFGPGFLRPVTPTLTDLEVTFHDMAFYVAPSLEGSCEVARAASLFEITTPLDALEPCECTSFYRGSNP